MTLTKTAAKSRWTDSAFIESARAGVQSIMAGASVLSDADLAGISIGKEGPVTGLAVANLYQARVQRSVFDFAEIEGSMNESEFRHVSFRSARLDGCVMRKSVLSDCTFAGARLVINLDDSKLERCDFSSASFSSGKAGHERGGRRVKFFDCRFVGAVFRSVQFRASEFVSCSFEDAKFVSCDLRGVKAMGGVLPRADQFERMDVPEWAI